MFIHSENVTHDVRSGLRSAAHGILLLVFDPPLSNHEDSARISRWAVNSKSAAKGGGTQCCLNSPISG